MVQAADTVLTQIARETHPGISDADLPEAISQIDQSDPRVGARIFGTAFEVSSEGSTRSVNTFHCRGMGRAGDGILKTTPGFQKKGASSSSQVSQLSSRLERLAEENARMRQHQVAMEEYQRALADWQQEVIDVQSQNNALQTQWMMDLGAALSQRLPTPSAPTLIPAPERPRPPPAPQQQDAEDPHQQQQQDPQQQQDDGQDPQEGDGDDMVDLDFDD